MTGLEVTAPALQAGGRAAAWRRFRRDRVGVVSGVVVMVILLTAILADVICGLLGIDLQRHIELLSIDNVGFPDGPFGGASAAHPLGLEPKTGRDVLALVLYGSRTSLTIALCSTALALLLAIVVGTVAGLLGGWVDTMLARGIDVLLAFPVFLFSIALLVVLGGVPTAGPLGGNALRVISMIFVIGFFAFPYGARLLRSQVISLRDREFVQAARALGARDGAILIHEIMPNLVGPIVVLAGALVPYSILSEAGLSFLGVGIQPPASSWGQLLGSASHVFTVDPAYMIVPGAAMVITVLGFTLLGDSLRDAFDPRTR